MIAFHTQLLAGSRNVVRVSVGEPEDIKPAGYANCAKLHAFIRLVGYVGYIYSETLKDRKYREVRQHTKHKCK